jgi:hypothetical protein
MPRVIKVALAAARLAYLVTKEDGPFGVADALRQTVIARFGTDSWQAAGITCPVCVSFWLAAVAWLFPDWLLTWLSTAEIARQLVSGGRGGQPGWRGQ